MKLFYFWNDDCLANVMEVFTRPINYLSKNIF